MNRRHFLTGAAALIGGLALNEAIPLGRVWSFPSKIVIPKTLTFSRDAFSSVPNHLWLAADEWAKLSPEARQDYAALKGLVWSQGPSPLLPIIALPAKVLLPDYDAIACGPGTYYSLG